MTAEDQSQSLEQLTKAVSQLAAALATSERRRSILSKRIRWTAASAVVMLAMGASMGFDHFKSAYAANGGGAPGGDSCNTLDCQLKPVSAFFMMMNKLMEGMVMSPDVHRYMYREYADFRAKADALSKNQASYAALAGGEELDMSRCEPSPAYDNCPAGNQQCPGLVDSICDDARWIGLALQKRFPALAGQTVVDMALVARRLRSDSDEFRDYLDSHDMADREGGPIAVVAQELHLMNQALRAVPIMASEMNAMNHQMSVMSYSVGSTMGRMGNIMPW